MDNESSETTQTKLQPGTIIGQKFKLEDKIGQGSFGLIFKCIQVETQEACAIKLEKRNSRHSSMLVREIKVMMEVKNEKGFARLNGYGKEDDYNYVAMTYLGRNLDSLLRKCSGKFKLPCLLNVFEQGLQRVQTLHSKNLIHRDIKPENFVIGYGQNFNQVHLIDFGLAKYFIDSDGNHIPFFEKKGMIGTARYASVNAHLGHEQSRRDDLEGLGYIMLYFLKGSLPWQSIQADNKEEKYEKIKQMKLTIKLEDLCKDVPVEFQKYFEQVKKLDFVETPNYEALYKLIHKMRADNGIFPDINAVDWQELPEYRQRKKFQTYTVNHNQRRMDDNTRNHHHRVSDAGQSKLGRPHHRKSVQHSTNLLQIPIKDGTNQPSVSQVSANTSKMNFSPVSQFDQDEQIGRQHGNNRYLNNSQKMYSIGDIEKYEEEEKKNNDYNNNMKNHRSSSKNNTIQQVKQSQGSMNHKLHESQNKSNNNTQKQNGTSSDRKKQFVQTSDKMDTGVIQPEEDDRNKIQVMQYKKAYKNDNM